MEITRTLYVPDRAGWRAWLQEHYRTEPDVWLVYYRRESGRPRVGYNDAVEEALCFGWIDSVVKPLPGVPGARAQRFTPRRPGSQLSETNKARVRRLVEEGRMTKAGLAALAGHPDALVPAPLRVAPDVRRALQAEPGAWRNFEAFPEAYKRIRLGWIEGARGRPEVFARRLRHFVRMTAQGKRYGMVRA